MCQLFLLKVSCCDQLELPFRPPTTRENALSGSRRERKRIKGEGGYSGYVAGRWRGS